jgi:hypothetical protein
LLEKSTVQVSTGISVKEALKNLRIEPLDKTCSLGTNSIISIKI